MIRSRHGKNIPDAQLGILLGVYVCMCLSASLHKRDIEMFMHALLSQHSALAYIPHMKEAIAVLVLR